MPVSFTGFELSDEDIGKIVGSTYSLPIPSHWYIVVLSLPANDTIQLEDHNKVIKTWCSEYCSGQFSIKNEKKYDYNFNTMKLNTYVGFSDPQEALLFKLQMAV